jgi:hypothetical protein
MEKILPLRNKLTILIFLMLFFAGKGHAQKWDQIIKQVAGDRNAQSSAGREVSDVYGMAVSLSGDYAAVSAYNHDGDQNGLNKIVSAGCVYILYNQAGTWVEVKKLVASDRSKDALFGYSVAIHGDYVVVGAIRESRDGASLNPVASAGAAYIYKKDQGGVDNWGQIKKITANDRDADDLFGYNVAIDGDYIVVGTVFEDHNVSEGAPLENSGSIHIFNKNQGGSENWGLVKKMTAPTRYVNGRFGLSVEIKGDYLAVGASESNLNSGSGSVYFFAKNQGGAGNWGYVQRVIASTQASSDYFGASVSISGEYAVIGAYAQDTDGSNANYVSGAGSAYVFKRNSSSGNWSQIKKLTAPVRAQDDNFGYCVAMSGDYIVIGAYKESQDATESNTKTESGSAYIFKKDVGGSDNWGFQKKITAAVRNAGDQFGYSLAISGNTIWSGAYKHSYDVFESDIMSWSGAAYCFQKDKNGSENWGQTQKMVSNGLREKDNYGWSVSVNGDYAAVGAPGNDKSANGKTLTDAGAVYILHHNGLTWNEIKKITAQDAVAGDNFGWSVALNNDYLVVGAPHEDGVNPATDSQSGAAYIFSRNQGGTNNWGQVKKIIADDRAASNVFGFSVGVDGEFIVVGARGASDQRGAAYLFHADQDGVQNWGQVKKLVSSEEIVLGRFGAAVAISGDYIVVGANRVGFQGNLEYTFEGSAYLFKRNGAGAADWSEFKIMKGLPGYNDGLGGSVALHGEHLIIGRKTVNFGSRPGSAFVYQKNFAGEDNWGLVRHITEDASGYAGFGSAVAINADAAMIGAPYHHYYSNGVETREAGAVYVYGINKGGENKYGLVERINQVSNSITTEDHFGFAVAMSDKAALIGVPDEDYDADQGSYLADAGSALFYKQQQICLPPEVSITNLKNVSATATWPAVTTGYPVNEYEYVFSYDTWTPNPGLAKTVDLDWPTVRADMENLIPERGYTIWARSTCRPDYKSDWKEVYFVTKACPDDISQMEIPDENDIYITYNAIQEGNLTHYCDCSRNKLLLTVEHSDSDLVIDQVAVQVDYSSVYYAGNQGFIANPDGAIFMPVRWDVYASQQPGKPVKVRYYFRTDQFTQFNNAMEARFKYRLQDEKQLMFYKHNLDYSEYAPYPPHIPAQQIQILTNGTQASTSRWVLGTRGSDRYAEFLVSSFSGGGAGSNFTNNSLPVRLMKFDVAKAENTALLTWSSTSETNTGFFDVQRSADGKKWSSLGRVEAAGQSSEIKSYSFKDQSPIPAENLYRLKMVDKDMTFSYSHIRSIVFLETNPDVYPNPAVGKLFVSATKNIQSIRIFNITGSMVYENTEVPADGINTSSFAPGIYTVQLLRTNGMIQTSKVIVAK